MIVSAIDAFEKGFYQGTYQQLSPKTCASDSKHFGSWDQNLLTEWHPRYKKHGVMIYWHTDRKSACIYS